ncbi:hypothetical protein NLG97_g8094 [Lecanicillium saksenae]|uniref:Uncharacterized protein n=1 Tax=Lecanicillium saksenae TaxID=468837 RepID=A0ACC1QN65_9HYPO|nr:hypothetical protein NLG97_g8094 [Lecanicillium saksenae]
MTLSRSERVEKARARPCPSWVLSTAALHQSWFCDDYKPISSFVPTIYDSEVHAIGIGTVHLSLKVTPDKSNHEHTTLTLRNVLHTPSITCNIIGTPILVDYQIIFSFNAKSKATITRKDGSAVGYFVPGSKRFELRLSGPPVGPKVGPSPFASDSGIISDPSSKKRKRNSFDSDADAAEHWPELVAAKSVVNPTPIFPTEAEEPPTYVMPLTDAEKRFLERYWGDEKSFLSDQVLRVSNEWDREKAHSVLRDFMADPSYNIK